MRKSFYLPGLLAFCFIFFSAAVKAAPADTVVILSNPVNDTIFPGFTAHFSVTAKDTPSATALNFSWQESTDGGATWNSFAFFGPTTDTTTSISVTPAIGAGNGNLYRCVVFNDNGNDTSFAAELVVLTGNPPQILSNPRDTTVCVTASAHFSVTAVDTPGILPISYTWFESSDGGATWDSVSHDFDLTDLSGLTTHTLSMASGYLLLHSGYEYMVVVGNDSGMNASTAATLNVDIITGLDIIGPTHICLGSSAELTSSYPGGTWSGVNFAVDTVESGTVFTRAPGTDTITYTIHNTCGSVSTSIFETVDTVLTGLPISGPDATCVGNTITLTNPNPGGTWSTTDAAVYVSPSGMVDGLLAGTGTIHYAITNSCNTADVTYTIQVDTVLDHGTVSGPSEVCAGSWVAFTASAIDGIWITSSSAIAVVDGGGNVTGISEGVAVISYYLSNACGVSVATDTIHVSGTVSHIMGLDSVGVGYTRLLTDSIPGGTWVSMNPSIATVGSASGLVTGVATGTVSIGYTVTNACGTSSASIVMIVGTASAGAIHGADTVCRGFTITLADTLASGGFWTSKHDSVATVDSFSGVVTGVSKGVDSVYYNYTNAFGTTRVSYPVIVEQRPVDSIGHPNIFSMGGSYLLVGYVFIKDTVVIDSTHVGGIATPYAVDSSIWKPTAGTWVSSDPSIALFVSGPSSGYLVIHGVGIATVTYTTSNRCGTSDTSFTIVIPFVSGVNDPANNTSILNVYPNPSTGNFTVNIVSAITEQAVVTVTNMVGEKVKEFTISTNQAAELSLDQPDGVYFISTTTSTGKYSAKITITK